MVERMKHPRINVDPNVMFGKPVIRGTRIPVDLVLQRLRFHGTFVGVLEEYPDLTSDDLKAAVHYATAHLPGQLAA